MFRYKGEFDMPHIVIKTISGPSQKQLQQAAEQIVDVINKTMDKPKECISVSVEEYSFDTWKNVYNEYIKDKNNILIKPKYDPKIFE